MTLTKKIVVTVFLLLSLSMVQFGCNKGPAEEAGETVDKAVEDAGDSLEDAGEKAKEAME